MQWAVWLAEERHDARILAFVETKAGAIFSRLVSHVVGGKVRLRYQGQAGNRVSHCALDLKTESLGTLHIEESADSDFAAVTKALRTAQSRLKRALNRRREVARRRRDTDVSMSELDAA